MFLDEKLVPVPEKMRIPMEKEQFNNIMLSMQMDKDKKHTMPVNVALVTRSMMTNEALATHLDGNTSIVNILPVIDNKVNQGYFSLLEVIRDFIMENFNPPVEAMLRTALIPVSAFKNEGEAYIYITLAIRDSDKEYFTKEGHYEFHNITEIPLNNLDWCSTIILPNEPIIK